MILEKAVSCGKLLFCYGDEENGHCAGTDVHLTTDNQSEIRKAYLVSVRVVPLLSSRSVQNINHPLCGCATIITTAQEHGARKC